MDDDHTSRIAAIYAQTYQPIADYVRQRCATPDDTADLVAETFVIAWHRITELSSADEARLRLYEVAHGLLAGQRHAFTWRRWRRWRR
jgi:RNA polymerase sigma-70 factor, ECF subfamily